MWPSGLHPRASAFGSDIYHSLLISHCVDVSLLQDPDPEEIMMSGSEGVQDREVALDESRMGPNPMGVPGPESINESVQGGAVLEWL